MANLKVSDNPKLNIDMKEMTKDTPAHYGEFNDRFSQLLENIAYLEKNKLAEKDIENYAKGQGIEFSVVDGILCATYDDGEESEE